MWVDLVEIKDIIYSWWNIAGDGSAMYRVLKKLDFVKSNVSGWNRSSFGQNFQEKVVLKEELDFLQHSI